MFFDHPSTSTRHSAHDQQKSSPTYALALLWARWKATFFNYTSACFLTVFSICHALFYLSFVATKPRGSARTRYFHTANTYLRSAVFLFFISRYETEKNEFRECTRIHATIESIWVHDFTIFTNACPDVPTRPGNVG